MKRVFRQLTKGFYPLIKSPNKERCESQARARGDGNKPRRLNTFM